jgi:glycosyltransferase involved in cell wall biosynthesis
MASLALNGITSFSVMPLRLISILGAGIFIFSCVMSIWILFKALFGKVVPGWASTLIPIYILGGLQIMLLGILGEYIGRIYKEVKARPRFIKDIELF